MIFFFLLLRRPTSSTLFPYTTLFRSVQVDHVEALLDFRIAGEFFRRQLAVMIGVALRQRRSESRRFGRRLGRSEEHTSELQSHSDLVCRLLLEKKKNSRTMESSATTP